MGNATEKLKERLTQVLKDEFGMNYPRVEISNIQYREGFYDRTDQNFYEMMMSEEHFEDIEVDRKAFLLSDYPAREINTNFEVGDVPILDDVVEVWREDEEFAEDSELYSESLSDLTLDQIKDLCSEAESEAEFERLMDQIAEAIEDSDYNDLEEFLDPLWGIGEDSLDIYEQLAYWIIYFKPDYWDEAVAWRVGLTPFTFEDEHYLALGGCGMDLSPKLDAYQALTTDTIPPSSQFIRQPDYAQNVVGERVFKEVMEKIQGDVRIEIWTGVKEIKVKEAPAKE